MPKREVNQHVSVCKIARTLGEKAHARDTTCATTLQFGNLDACRVAGEWTTDLAMGGLCCQGSKCKTVHHENPGGQKVEDHITVVVHYPGDYGAYGMLELYLERAGAKKETWQST
eukprot:3978632-Amphidinium_carterae.1